MVAPGRPPAVTPEIVAEASVWVARLHGPDRTLAMERECLAWQARSAAHRLAFERCTETWQDVAGITLADALAAPSIATSARAAGGPRRGPAWWAAGMGLVGVALAAGTWALWGGLPWRPAGEYHTGVGEQQVVILADGSRLSLNTDTRVRVRLGADRRVAEVRGGEALFEVAREARPFAVRAAGSEVLALGTAFVVRTTGDATGDAAGAGQGLAVTLIEGRVSVQPPAAAAVGGRPGPAPAPITLQPGDRVRLAAAGAAGGPPVAPQLDRPPLADVAAWKRNEAVFDDASLAEAVAEMNRYDRTKLVLVGAAAQADKRVSGVFRAGDNAGFARALAALHGLQWAQREGRIELTVGGAGQTLK